MKRKELAPNEVSKLAIKIAHEYYSHGSRCAKIVSGKKAHRGYDLLAPHSGGPLRIEVKGCSKDWQIPDFFETEFDRRRVLVADLLCVVYLIPGKRPKLCEIPRSAIRPKWVTAKKRYRISSKFKNEKALAKYIKPLRKRRAV